MGASDHRREGFGLFLASHLPAPISVNMLRQMTHYFTALVFLAALSVIYDNVVSPWMRPPVVTAIAPKDDSLGPTDDSLGDLFPEGAWQRGTCKQLQTATGMLLFSSWKQISSDQWKLWPVTVIVGRGISNHRSQDPVIIDAPEGAEIVFTEALDVMSGGAPPIHQGRMIGPVEIRRPSSDEAGQALSIRTANVGIDNRKVWTTEAIAMNFGEAKMAGRDLTVYFAGPTGAGGDAVAVLDRMELIYLDELVMPLESGGLLNSASKRNGSVAATSQPGVDHKAKISIQCGGRVEYDFALDQLSLRDSVSLVHQLRGSPADQFHCETLELKLRDPTNDLIRRDGPMDWLVHMVATGAPATAVLPSFDAELAAESIDFDAVAGLIRANGKKGVRVRRGAIQATLAQLAYQFDPERPDAIGAIDVQGAGIVNVSDPRVPILRAHWRDGFSLKPTQSATAKDFDADVELLIDGDIHATLTDGGEFMADALQGVLKPVNNTSPNDQQAKISLLPERFEATGHVRVDTAAIAAETEHLLLFFVDPANEPARQRDPNATAGATPLRQWVIQPGSGESMVDPVARPRPVIRGDLITAQLRLDKEGVNAKDLSVRGKVQLTHLLQAGGQMLPAKLTGERLRLIDGGGEDLLQLESGVGSPARFDLGDGFFIGPLIQIRPNDNIVWIKAAGEFRMPTAALPTSLTGDSESQFQWTRAPHCRWHGEMIFDGRSAVLTDGVEINASLLDGRETWDLQMLGDRLQVDLQQDVRVSDMQTIKNATLGRVTLMKSKERPVVVRALRRAADGVLEAKHVIHAAKLTLMPGGGDASGNANTLASGKLVGEGPGWYRGWMIPMATNEHQSIGNAAPVNPNERQLTGIHLIFHDKMLGDLATKSLEFLRGVRVGSRAVEDWEDTFDAAAMDAISMGDSTLDCDRLQFTVAPGWSGRSNGAPTPWEMEATSGVVFRTRSDRGLLEGTASRAAYSSLKDLFTVEGAPNRPANFRQTLPNGQKGPEGAVKTMTLRPKTMEVQNMQLERLNIATPPAIGRR